jgi:SAM-dependent methyltransferase
LATSWRGETIARETFETHARGEATAREALERQLRGESAARETLARHLRGEIAAREALERHLRGETAARETLATTVREEARELSAARRALADRVALTERKLRRLFLRLSPEVVGGSPRDPLPSPASLPPLQAAPFDYAGFEDRFRGDEQAIKDRQRRYLTLFEGQHDVLDIGCGRGEFLELCREADISARGVDLDLDMVLTCRDKRLGVVQDDAFRYLAALPDESLGGIFAAQLVEHLQPSAIVELVELCHRKLRVGARAVFETPNPGCLLVFARSFYADPTHIRPIHADAMTFLLESAGFEAVTIQFSAPIEAAARIPLLPEDGVEAVRAFNQGLERLNDLLFGFQDYKVIGTKALRPT